MTYHTFENARPANLPYAPEELKELVILSQLCRYNRTVIWGAKAIQRELESLNIHPLPALSFISKVLKEKGLTYRRTGNY